MTSVAKTAKNCDECGLANPGYDSWTFPPTNSCTFGLSLIWLLTPNVKYGEERNCFSTLVATFDQTSNLPAISSQLEESNRAELAERENLKSIKSHIEFGGKGDESNQNLVMAKESNSCLFYCTSRSVEASSSRCFQPLDRLCFIPQLQTK